MHPRALLNMAIAVLGVAYTFAVPPAQAQDPASLKATYKRPTEIPFPPSNPYTPEKAALGKALYFEPRLSGAENMNCATCHNPSFGWEGPSKTAIGAMGTRLGRQAQYRLGSPTLLGRSRGGRRGPGEGAHAGTCRDEHADRRCRETP
jgi:cytochrome c peroxidase